MAGNNYNILVGVELETSNIQSQLNKIQKNKSLKIDVDSKNAESNLKSLNNTMNDTALTFNAANEIFRTSIDIISSMVSQVFELDSALVEFQKVSDLSGRSLENYVSKLTDMGNSVARTGKPRCLAPGVRMAN